MATSNKKIFNTFLNLIKDRNLCVSLTDQEISEILTNYLKEAISLRFKNCRKNLSNRTEPEFFRQNYVGNGTEDHYIISQIKTALDAESLVLVCEVGGIASTYTFDEGTLTFIISPVPVAGRTINLGYDFTGEFTEDLSEEEIQIISNGMLISWTSQIINDENKLRDKFTTRDFKSFSPANLLKELSTWRKDILAENRNLLVSYSFDSFEGFN